MKRSDLIREAAGWPVVITAFDAVQQSRDGAGPFLQEANFLWATGIDEPGWKYIITKEKSILVAPKKDDVQYLFDGGMSTTDALRISGANEVLSAEDGDGVLADLARDFDVVYTIGEDPQRDHYDFMENPAPERLRQALALRFSEIKDCRSVFSKLRACKSADEVSSIRHAVSATIAAFSEVNQLLSTKEVRYEYEVEAHYTYALRRAGMSGHAYAPIVAGGRNALTLHYCKNNDQLPENGLVLMDVGARYGGYAADITRTYAIGNPTARERAVHAAVEKAHHAIIALIKPGVSLQSYQDDSDAIMKEALKELGLLNTPDEYRIYFPHAISHGLGLDVHESLGGFGVFQPGMVLTVEPGIYIPKEGIGVRIEDDILVTEDGNENLSAALPTGL